MSADREKPKTLPLINGDDTDRDREIVLIGKSGHRKIGTSETGSAYRGTTRMIVDQEIFTTEALRHGEEQKQKRSLQTSADKSLIEMKEFLLRQGGVRSIKSRSACFVKLRHFLRTLPKNGHCTKKTFSGSLRV
jgi:hypothetical protein